MAPGIGSHAGRGATEQLGQGESLSLRDGGLRGTFQDAVPGVRFGEGRFGVVECGSEPVEQVRYLKSG